MVGSRIARVTVHDTRILDAGARPARVVAALEGRRVKAVERRGKWLRVALDRGALFSHLGMSGKWAKARPDEAPARFEKVRLDVRSNRTERSVRYLDARLFGRFAVPAEDLPVWAALGPDPLVDGIDLDALQAKLAHRRLAIKPTLLDQTVLAGVGNIYATEALFSARIDPRRPARELSRPEIAALARGIRQAIAKALRRDSGRPISYVQEAGVANPFTIYGNEGHGCPRCKTPLRKMLLAGRGTVFCGHCQR